MTSKGGREAVLIGSRFSGQFISLDRRFNPIVSIIYLLDRTESTLVF